MPTAYPNGFDDFGVPSLPEQTPLSSAGDSTRNHTELLRDIGDATEQLEHHASQRAHDHSGDATDTKKGAKLSQANTHQSPDTDTAGGIHRTVGTGHEQAARGDHIHDYASLTGKPIVACTSTTRPGTPTLGLLIYETDTYRLRVWAQYPGDTVPSWRFLLGPLPNVRLRQTAAQQLTASGSILEWREELEDAYNSFDKNVSLTNINVKEAGVYQITVALQWDPSVVPDTAHVIVCVNGVETTVRQSQFMRGGGLFNPGFSQTITVTGPLRLALNDVLTVKAKYTASGGLLGFIFSFFDGPSKVNSRFDLVYQGP